MKKFKLLLPILACSLFLACNDNDDDNERKQFTIYSHLDSDKPTILNEVADLSNYIDLSIETKDNEIATAKYYAGKGFIVNALKEGNTIITVKEKDKIKYEIKVIVEYNGSGDWDIVNTTRTIICDADLKDIIEQDSPFYDNQNKSYYNFISIGKGKVNFVDINFNKKLLDFNYSKLNKEYVFSDSQNKDVKLAYSFCLLFVSNVGIIPQHKRGIFWIDRTKEYQDKYPDKNIRKITEEYRVECWYDKQ